MPDPVAVDESLGRATAGQLRRAGFAVAPETIDDSATQGFEVLCNHGDAPSVSEFDKARKRGDHMPTRRPPTSPASSQPTPTVA